MTAASSSYKTHPVGALHSLEHRVYLENEKGDIVSPFHDVPLFVDETRTIANMIVEIPRWSNAKLEMATGEPFNPIKQDVKKGALRFVKNIFPYTGYIFNYGALPQTWEDPTHVDPETKCKGDNDPVDAVEIGDAVGFTGQVKQVKILGTLALLDEGETDWKVIVIDAKDPQVDKLNDIEDVEKVYPGLLKAITDWFRIYKIPDGKPANAFAFNGEAKDKSFALKVIKETHDAWKRLITKQVPNKTEQYNLATVNVAVEGSPYKVSKPETAIPAAEQKVANPVDASLGKWYFISNL